LEIIDALRDVKMKSVLYHRTLFETLKRLEKKQSIYSLSLLLLFFFPQKMTKKMEVKILEQKEGEF